MINIDNDSPLLVPGIGLPIEHELEARDRFAHGINEYQQAPAITARELAMLKVMGHITDKEDWDRDIFNDSIAAEWATYAAQQYPLLSEAAWSWCLTELRDKAIELRAAGFVRIADAGTCACKTDRLIAPNVAMSLQLELRSLFDDLFCDDTIENDGDDGTYSIVDPDLHPLIFGTTHALRHTTPLKLTNDSPADMLISTNHCQVTEEQPNLQLNAYLIDRAWPNRLYMANTASWSSTTDAEIYLWSRKYQRLPCDVRFVGANGADVRIDSYINNLHPNHKPAYKDIEKIISASIPLWNACLVKGSLDRHNEDHNVGHQTQVGRIPLRIVTFGANWEEEQTVVELEQNKMIQFKKKTLAWAREQIDAGRPKSCCPAFGQRMRAEYIARDWMWLDRVPSTTMLDLPISPPTLAEKNPIRKEEWIRSGGYEHPEPGVSFSYGDWKAGRNIDRAVIKMISQRKPSHHSVLPPTHESYAVELEQTFRDKGLQVIVQISGVQGQHDGSWQLEGILNEHIVAASVYAFDVENVVAKITFRQETPAYSNAYRYERGKGPIFCQKDPPEEIRLRNNGYQYESEAIAEVFGFGSLSGARLKFQETDTVIMSQGRLVTFSNCVEHKIETSLVDKDKPGHFRFVKIHLVDPNYRICSTSSVRPQQHEWCFESLVWMLMQKGLPRELADEIVELSQWPMSMEYAKAVKTMIKKERDRAMLARHSRVGYFDFRHW